MKGKTSIGSRKISKPKRTEDAIKESEARYKILVENASDQLFLIDENYKYLSVNKKLAESLGKKPEQIIGKSVVEAFPEDMANRFLKNLNIVFKTGKGLNLDEKIELPGNEIWANSQLTPIKDNKGKIKYIAGIVRDITERKKTEEELKNKTAFLEAQINSTIDGILIVDNKGTKLLQNQRCINLWKIPKDIAALNDDSKQIEFVKNRTKYPEKFVEKVVYLYAHPKEISQDEIEFKDGMVLDRYSSPVIGKDGTNFGRIWFFRDITEKKKSEEALAKSNNQIKSILDAASQISIIATDCSGTVITFNVGAEKMLGYKASELIGKKTPAIMHLESEVVARGKELTAELGYLVEGFEVFVAYAKQGKYEEREWTYIRKDKVRLAVNLTVTAVKNKAEEVIGFLGVATDITERKQAEEALKKKTAELQKLNFFFVDRELKMVELKKKIKELEENKK
jgi:PAS domain S-box-containing protein